MPHCRDLIRMRLLLQIDLLMSRTMRKYPANQFGRSTPARVPSVLCASHGARIILRPITQLHALFGALSQKAIHGFAVRHWITWKTIAQIIELNLRREERSIVFAMASGTSRRAPAIAQADRMPLTVRATEAGQLIEFGVVMHRRKEIQNLPVISRRRSGLHWLPAGSFRGTGNPDRSLDPHSSSRSRCRCSST